MPTWNTVIDTHTKATNTDLPSYAQVVGAVNRQAGENGPGADGRGRPAR